MDIFGNFSKLKGDNDKRKVFRKKELDFSYSDLTLEPVGKIESKESVRSIFMIKALIIFLFCIVVLRLFDLQVVEGDMNQSLAEGNRIRPRIIEANRGLITDKDGYWLARNKPDFALSVYPSDLPRKKNEREEIYSKIAAVSHLSVDEIMTTIQGNGSLADQHAKLSSLDMVILKDNISHDDALLLEEEIVGLSGVFVSKQSMREYLTLPGLSHIIGYTSKLSPDDMKNKKEYNPSDRIGKTGLEFQYEENLKGINGVEQIEVNSRGLITRVIVDNQNTEPVPGENISLYLNKEMQTRSAAALLNGIESAKQLTGDDTVNSGVAILMDVHTGGIIASVSLPDFDNNLFATTISSNDYKRLIEDKTNPMFDRSIKGNYPPGSISKIVLAAAGLAEGVISTNFSFDTPSAITIGDYSFPDWKDHGVSDIKTAIAESNNIFFYMIGGGFEKVSGLGMTKIEKWWRLFGLGEKTGVDLPGESDGFLPTPGWKKETRNEPWYIGDTYHVSIGQGDLLVTPMQMLRATAAIANGGKLVSPQFVSKVTDDKGNVLKEFSTRIERENFVPNSVLETVREGMRSTITDGSARNLDDLPFTVAGKTGTAQFLNNQKTHAWFTAFAPYEDPEVAVITFIDGGGGGHEIAAPIAKEILSAYFSLKN